MELLHVHSFDFLFFFVFFFLPFSFSSFGGEFSSTPSAFKASKSSLWSELTIYMRLSIMGHALLVVCRVCITKWVRLFQDSVLSLLVVTMHGSENAVKGIKWWIIFLFSISMCKQIFFGLMDSRFHSTVLFLFFWS